MNLEEAKTWVRNVEAELGVAVKAIRAAESIHAAKYNEYLDAWACVRRLEQQVAVDAKEAEG